MSAALICKFSSSSSLSSSSWTFMNRLNSVQISSSSLLTPQTLSSLFFIQNRKAHSRRSAFRSINKKITGVPEKIPIDPIVQSARKTFGKTIIPEDMAELRFAYPEFLPISDAKRRNSVMEQIMREDMINRRTVIDIPEFYVGTIMAVTITDHWASGKLSKFVGICIERNGQGTYANFTLRNRVDGQGIEIRYDLYNPVIQEIQILKLEKRLDDHLLYLRDALPKYSEIPFDMAPEPPRKLNEPIPINPLKVEMKPWPWTKKWQYYDLKGIEKFPNIPDYNYLNIWKRYNELLKYDLMNEYRQHISEDEQLPIWKQVDEHQKQIKQLRELERRRKLIQK